MSANDRDQRQEAHHHTGHREAAEPATQHLGEAYQRAYAAAQPDAGRTVISLDLDARETDWTVAPGNWMYHCHILEHQVGGMMAHFEVVP